MLKFSESHEWILIDGEVGRVGISDHAQHELGDIVYVELPKLGDKVKMGAEVAVLESTKAAADIYSPASGVIVEVNEKLKENPELINESPEDQGWILKIKFDNKSELEQLLDSVSYQSMLHGKK